MIIMMLAIPPAVTRNSTCWIPGQPAMAELVIASSHEPGPELGVRSEGSIPGLASRLSVPGHSFKPTDRSSMAVLGGRASRQP